MKTQLSRKPENCIDDNAILSEKFVVNVPGNRRLCKSISSISASSDYEAQVPDVVDVSDDNNSITSSTNSVKSDKSLTSTLNVEPYRKVKTRRHHRRKVHIYGHRGSPYKAAENTLESFQTSAELGCDGVELDVFLLKCGTLVVFHGSGGDMTPGGLMEYCGIEGSILDYSAEEARKLPFNPESTQFKILPKYKLENAVIPTLEEVLRSAKKNEIIVKIELKGPNTVEPVLELVEELDMVDQCHFSSFYHDRIAELRRLRPHRLPDGSHKYRTGALFKEPPVDFIEMAKKIDATEVHLRYDTCTKERIEAIHAAGLDSLAWFRNPLTMEKDAEERFHDVGNEDEAMYHAVLSSGVKAMCVNKPDVLLQLLDD